MCSRKLKGRSALRAETHKHYCCSPFIIQGLTGYSPFRSRNLSVEHKSTLERKKKTSVCDEENYWFPCSLNGGHVLRQCGRVQVGFSCLSSLPSVCLSVFCLYILYALCFGFTSPCLAGRFSLLGSEPHLRRTYTSKPGAWIKFLYIVSVCFEAHGHTSTQRGFQIPCITTLLTSSSWTEVGVRCIYLSLIQLYWTHNIGNMSLCAVFCSHLNDTPLPPRCHSQTKATPLSLEPKQNTSNKGLMKNNYRIALWRKNEPEFFFHKDFHGILLS